MTEPMTVVGVVVTKHSVTLYDENWKGHVFLQGTPDIKPIQEHVIPEFNKNGIATFTPVGTIPLFSTFESKSKVIQFFIMTARKLRQYFHKEENGQLSAQLKRLLENDRTGLQKLKMSENDGIDPGYLEKDNSAKHDSKEESDKEIAVAVVEGNIIPNIDKLAVQINHSNITNNVTGMENLLIRLGKIVQHRDHQIEDILRFLEKSDLPITDSGNILVYKAVNQRSSYSPQTSLPYELDLDCYVDSHTKKVIQWKGAMVQVPESYVNKNREIECAQGLHVARRSYLSKFMCDSCLLCIVRPEDFIAVPDYDSNKVRVSAYQIIDVLTDEEYEKLMNSKSFFVNENSERKYERAVHEKYPEPTHRITVAGPYGTHISYKVLDSIQKQSEPTLKEKPIHIEESILSLTTPPGETIKVSSYNSTPAYVSKDMLKLLPISNREDAVRLAQWKACHKKSWLELGVDDENALLINMYLNG